MDKETLSTYGWIVVSVIVLVLFIGYASGFINDIVEKATAHEEAILLNKTKDSKEDLTLIYEVRETWKCGENLNAYIMKTNDTENPKYKIYIKPAEINKDADYSMYSDSSKWKLINTMNNIITPLGTEYGLEKNQGIKESSVVFESLDFSSRITKIQPILSIWKNDSDGNPTNHIENLNEYDATDETTDSICTLKVETINLPKDVTTIPSNCFAYDTIQDSINGPSVIILEDNALAYNFEMRGAHFNNLVTIKKKALYYASNLNSFYFADSITEIDQLAFAFSSLDSVEINSKKITINQEAFLSCSGLESINISYNIPNSNITLESDFIAQCSNLEKIYLPSGTLSCSDEFFDLWNWDINNDVVYYFNNSFQEWLIFKEKNSITTPDYLNIICTANE